METKVPPDDTQTNRVHLPHDKLVKKLLGPVYISLDRDIGH
jgi:hypothetical protein